MEKPADIENSVEAHVFKLFSNLSNYLGMFTMNTEGIITIISGDFTREVAETQGMYILDIIHDVKGIIDSNQSLATPFHAPQELFKRIIRTYSRYYHPSCPNVLVWLWLWYVNIPSDYKFLYLLFVYSFPIVNYATYSLSIIISNSIIYVAKFARAT